GSCTRPARRAALGGPLHASRIIEGEQGGGVTGPERAAREPALHGGRQAQQPQRVGDRWARAADAIPELVLGAAEVVQQLLIGVGLLERIQLAAVQVL